MYGNDEGRWLIRAWTADGTVLARQRRYNQHAAARVAAAMRRTWGPEATVETFEWPEDQPDPIVDVDPGVRLDAVLVSTLMQQRLLGGAHEATSVLPGGWTVASDGGTVTVSGPDGVWEIRPEAV